jgi:uncharacterized membrane protein
MIKNLTLPGAIHTVLAMLGIVVGPIQLLRPKGGSMHRALGYAFVYAMLVADGTAMLFSSSRADSTSSMSAPW